MVFRPWLNDVKNYGILKYSSPTVQDFVHQQMTVVGTIPSPFLHPIQMGSLLKGSQALSSSPIPVSQPLLQIFTNGDGHSNGLLTNSRRNSNKGRPSGCEFEKQAPHSFQNHAVGCRHPWSLHSTQALITQHFGRHPMLSVSTLKLKWPWRRSW